MTEREILQRFEAACRDPVQFATGHGYSPAAIFCSYAPRELLHAAGLSPIRIYGYGRTRTGAADAHLQPYSCSVAKCVMETLLDQPPELRVYLFSHCCDTMQGLSDIARLKVQASLFENLMIPTRLGTPGASRYLLEELERLKGVLEKFCQKAITTSTLTQSMQLYRDARGCLERMTTLRRGRLARPKDVHLAFVAFDSMPVEEFLPLATELLQIWQEDPQPQPGVPVVLVGSVIFDPSLFDILEEASAVVVDDDLCTGTRQLWPTPRADGSLSQLVQGISHRPLCPTKHAAPGARMRRICHMAQQADARGVLLAQLKYCEPHAFDVPLICQRLDEAQIPHLHLEIEQPLGRADQVRTRIEAFVEMIGEWPSKWNPTSSFES